MTLTILTLAVAASAATSACGPAATLAFEVGETADRFTVENASTDGWSIDGVELTLAETERDLVFDVRAGGPGADEAYPFTPRPEDVEGATTSGAATLSTTPVVGDGEDRLVMAFERFEPGQRFVFVLDVDKALAGVGRALEASDIEGTAVSVVFRKDSETVAQEGARFGADATARAAEACEG